MKIFRRARPGMPEQLGVHLRQVRRTLTRVMPKGRALGRGARLGLLALLVVLAAPSSHAQIESKVGQDGVIELSNGKSGKRRSSGGRAQRGTGSKKPKLQPVMPRPLTAASKSRYDAHIREAAQLYHLPEALIRAVIKVESNFDPRAVSPANAQGLMQMLPSTAERMMVTDIFDPRQNILGGSRYLRVLANTFNGNLQLTIAGYNAGEGAVAKYGGIPPYQETQHYVVKVLQYYQQYRQE